MINSFYFQNVGNDNFSDQPERKVEEILNNVKYYIFSLIKNANDNLPIENIIYERSWKDVTPD